MSQTTWCGVAGWGVVAVPWKELGPLRSNPGSTNLAKHLKMVDDQTLVAALAMQRAIDDAGWQERSFRDWALLAAPRYLGRTRIAVTCARYRKNLLRGYNPLIIPNQSLHAVAGTLSIAWEIHGPNFGISGGPDHVGEALLTGLTLLHGGDVPGAWVVVSGFEPEPVPTPTGDTETPTVGHAVALALTLEYAEAKWSLQIEPCRDAGSGDVVNVAELAAALQATEPGGLCRSLDGIGQLSLRPCSPLLHRQAG